MSVQSKPYSTERVELTGMLAEFRDALEEEIDKIKKSGQSSTLLRSGRRVESHGAELWYRFNVEYVPALPADTPCKLMIGKDQYDVTVISFEENSIIISFPVFSMRLSTLTIAPMLIWRILVVGKTVIGA